MRSSLLNGKITIIERRVKIWHFASPEKLQSQRMVRCDVINACVS